MPGPALQNDKAASLCQACRSGAGSEENTLNHWWEAPAGLGLRGRAVLNTFPVQTVPDLPTQSDLTHEVGGAWNGHSDDACAESGQVISATPCKVSVPDAERVPDLLNKASPEAAVSSNGEVLNSSRGSSAEVESSKCQEAHQKERANGWSDEEGKMLIQGDLFAAVLPSADEVGLQWRVSELRVALRASESSRLENEKETEALRNYLAEVEAAAAGLQSRVHELEHLIAFSSKDETRELDQLRAKMAMEASKEAHTQTAKAARAVAAAREATMELDKVKRHASSLIKGQEEEVDRLRKEAAECRMLYHARTGELEAMKEQMEKLNTKSSSGVGDEALKASQNDVIELQKCLEGAKAAVQEKTNQYEELLVTFELQKKVVQSTETYMKELESQKRELVTRNDWLEQRVVDLEKQELVAATANYDHELCKAQAILGAEKQHLLAELARLRCGNQTLEVELVEWQEKFHALSKHVFGIESASDYNSNTEGPEKKMQSTNTWSCDLLEENSFASKQGQDKRKICIGGPLTPIENLKDTGSPLDRKGMVSQQECVTPSSIRGTAKSNCCLRHNNSRKHSLHGWDGHCGTQGKGPKEQHKMGCKLSRENLLAAAHREIVKLKEINQCLVAACQEFKLAEDCHQDMNREKLYASR